LPGWAQSEAGKAQATAGKSSKPPANHHFNHFLLTNKQTTGGDRGKTQQKYLVHSSYAKVKLQDAAKKLSP